jgi:hypothetical protein
MPIMTLKFSNEVQKQNVHWTRATFGRQKVVPLVVDILKPTRFT